MTIYQVAHHPDRNDRELTMNENYFPILFRCVVVSIGLLVSATLLKWGPLSTIGGGVAPLIYYHIFYLTPRAKTGLSQSAIDSVYYFGFLVTVFALSISAVTVAMNKITADQVNLVIYQFGVGLLATGYAVIARMHLSSVTSIDNATPEVVLDNYMKRSMDFVNTLEDASVRMTGFSKTLISTTQELSDSSRTMAERAMRDVARIFADEMSSSLALTRDGLAEIRNLVADTSFISEREELARTIKATVESATALNLALDNLAEKSSTGAEATQQSIAYTEKLTETIRELSKKVTELGGDDGALATTVISLKKGGDSIARGATSMGHAVEHIAAIADAVADTGPTFDKMREVAKKTHTQLDSLSEVTDKLDSALVKISASAESSQSAAQGFERIASVLPALAVSAETLTTHLDKATEISGSLKLVADSIEVAAAHAKQLTASVIESSKGVEGAGKLISGASELQVAVSSLQKVVALLASTVQATQQELSGSANGLKTSITASTAALEADVRRSSQAATLLTEQLTKVAQGIIDQTQEKRSGTK